MQLSQILNEIDAQISRLQQARALLTGTSAAAPDKPRRGRPKGSGKNVASVVAKPLGKGRRTLSPEGRKAIAEAMKRRWAERNKQQAK